MKTIKETVRDSDENWSSVGNWSSLWNSVEKFVYKSVGDSVMNLVLFSVESSFEDSVRSYVGKSVLYPVRNFSEEKLK